MHQLAIRPDPGLATRLDRVIEQAIAEHRMVGAVVLVACEGTLAFTRAAGMADREAGLPMREDTIFRLASLTKPIVTAAMLRLVEEGRLGLDQAVTEWLPDFRPALPDGTRPVITLRQLLTHTSGLGYRFLDPEDGPYHQAGVSDGLDQPGLDLDENLRRLAGCPLYFPPGQGWRYSLGIDVVGRVLEKATGRDLPEIVAALVTEPLAMTDTAFAVTDPERLAAAYADGMPAPARMVGETPVRSEEGVVRFTPDRHLDPASFPSGGGGMIGTAGDFLRFLETVRGDGAPILRETTLRTMQAVQVDAPVRASRPGWGFGLGWAVLADPVAAGSPQSPGTLHWGGAYGHSWFVDPARALSVVALTNTAFAGVHGAFPTALRDAVYG